MDLATLIGNKPLLADLQREYEVLKRSDGEWRVQVACGRA
jgi:hypothetical protein